RWMHFLEWRKAMTSQRTPNESGSRTCSEIPFQWRPKFDALSTYGSWWVRHPLRSWGAWTNVSVLTGLPEGYYSIMVLAPAVGLVAFFNPQIFLARLS